MNETSAQPSSASITNHKNEEEILRLKPLGHEFVNDETNSNIRRSSVTNGNKTDETYVNNGIEKGLENRLLSSSNRPEENPDNTDNTNPTEYPALRFDVNTYQQKKTLAQGMMDLALFSANANQLRYILEQPEESRNGFYYLSLTFILMSIFLQVTVGIGLIWNGLYNIKKSRDCHRANLANNITVLGIFLILILNVFISSFGIPSATIATSIPGVQSGLK